MKRPSPKRNITPPSRKKNSILFGSIILGAIGLGILLFLSTRPTPPIDGIIQYPRPERGHDNTLVIPAGELPPHGGVHNDIWQNCGVYTQPVRAEHAVHSLEHGAVWITYQSDLDPAEVMELESMVRGDGFLLLSPYPTQRSPIVLTAWGLQLEVASIDDGRVEEFISRYRLGPQTPEVGASCTRGVGEPG
jgi:hypothetical protein